jgi:two-component system, sensor histidine kinase and response regulator
MKLLTVDRRICRPPSFDFIHLKVVDNGRGFDLHQQGLQGMQERVTALDGEFRLTTSPGSGCQIQVKLPVLLEI